MQLTFDVFGLDFLGLFLGIFLLVIVFVIVDLVDFRLLFLAFFLLFLLFLGHFVLDFFLLFFRDGQLDWVADELSVLLDDLLDLFLLDVFLHNKMVEVGRDIMDFLKERRLQ